MLQEKKTLLLFLSLWLIANGLALWNLSLRPTLPVPISIQDTGLFIEIENAPAAQVIAINHQPVSRHFELEDYIDFDRIGNEVSLSTAGGELHRQTLVARYDWQFILMKALVSLFFFSMSTLILLNEPSEGERHFAYSGYLFGFSITAWWSGLQLALPLSITLLVIYFFSYAYAYANFFYFSFHFPNPPASDKFSRRKRLFIAAGITLATALLSLYLWKYFYPSPRSMAAYNLSYRVFRILVFSVLGIAIANMFRNARGEANPVARRKIQWVTMGIILGAFPFYFLWNLPRMLQIPPLFPEWALDIFFITIPTSLAIAILRYRLFDIEIVLSRSLVYGTVSAILIALYVLLTGGMSVLLQERFTLESPYLSIAAVLLVVLLANPLRVRVQRFVDRKFFRIRYHQFHSMQAFLRELEHCSTREALLKALDTHFNKSVPLSQQCFLLKIDEQWRTWRQHEDAEAPWISWVEESANSELPALLVSRSRLKRIEKGLAIATSELPDPWVVALPVGEKIIWLMARKQSGRRFWQEDLDLARQMVQAAILQLEKLTYLQLAIRESIEKEQAQKRSEWKTMLVAEVAHDLRSPLSTMLWKLRNLESELVEQPTPDTQAISGLRNQIHRLQSFVHNMLLLSNVEHGEFQVQRQPVAIRQELSAVLDDLQEVISQKQLDIRNELPASARIGGDPVMFREIMLNLIENSAKFSPRGGRITAFLTDQNAGNGKVNICLEDQAGGIPEKVMQNLFEPFRNEPEDSSSQKGFNLGLYITRQFTEAMRGNLTVHSTPGQGTIFRLSFPSA